jgi:hypothetical protein
MSMRNQAGQTRRALTARTDSPTRIHCRFADDCAPAAALAGLALAESVRLSLAERPAGWWPQPWPARWSPCCWCLPDRHRRLLRGSRSGTSAIAWRNRAAQRSPVPATGSALPCLHRARFTWRPASAGSYTGRRSLGRCTGRCTWLQEACGSLGRRFLPVGPAVSFKCLLGRLLPGRRLARQLSGAAALYTSRSPGPRSSSSLSAFPGVAPFRSGWFHRPT